MIEWAVSSSVLILIVLAARTLGKKRLSCRVRYALWLLALLRLLIPVQLFSASWGVPDWQLPWRLTVGSLGYKQYAALELPTYGWDGNGEPVFSSDAARQQWREFLDNTRYDGAPRQMEAGVSADEAKAVIYDYRWSVADALRAIWLIGAGVTAIVLLACNLVFVRRLRRSRVPCDAPGGGMRVYVAQGLDSPCLIGVFRPSIYLTPENAADERMLGHVLAHETTHRIHGDGIWCALRLAALCLHWYNPLVWLAAAVSKHDGELACDEATLARLGEEERSAYGETLLTLVRAKPGTRDLLSASTAMTAGKKAMRERIETIAAHPRTRIGVLLLALAVLLSATVLAFSKEGARMSKKEALDALADSVYWQSDSNVCFSLPTDYAPASDWNIRIAGRAVYDDGTSMSVSFFEGEEWKPGSVYNIWLDDLRELTLTAWFKDRQGEMLERTIDLMPPSGREPASWEADLNGDGAAERIVLDVDLLEGQAFLVPWVESAKGEKLCELDPIGFAQAVWNTYALAELDGKTYLMEYRPNYGTDAVECTLILWTVSAASVHLTQEYVKRVEFPTAAPLTEAQRAEAAAFMDEANALWSHSRLLFTTDGEVMAHLYDAETGEAVAAGEGRCFLAGAGAVIRYRETLQSAPEGEG